MATITWYKNDKKVHSKVKTTDKSVTAEMEILTNVTDNEARYRCEAANSATEIPLFETIQMSVYCKYQRPSLCEPKNVLMSNANLSSR